MLRNGTSAGTATVSGTGWTFDDTIGASVSGTQTYTARAEAGALSGVASAGYAILVDNVIPPEVANVTGIFDDFVGAVPAGGSTTDSTPQISGTLSTALNAVAGAATETLQVLRNGALLSASISFPTSTTWNLTDPGPMTAGTTYNYSARVVDAAGNQGAAGTPRAATYDATTRGGLIASATNLNNGAPIASGAGSFTSATSIRLAGSITNGPLLAGQTLRVLRNAIVLSTATVTGSQWSFDDTSPPNGAVSYTVQVVSSGATGAQSPAYAFTVDNIRPAQTFTFAAFSSVAPNSTTDPALGVATPASSSIAAGGSTNDSTPTVRVTLSSALGSGESLVVRRVLNGGTATEISPPVLLTISCGALCFEFTESSAVVSIPVPTTTPNSGLPGGGALQYRVSVRDAALNETLTPGTFSLSFDYFTCNQVRANDTYRRIVNPTGFHQNVNSGAVNCAGCHTVSTPSAVTYVAVPMSTPTYWCRRPF